ncbi:MAG: hypothetical protein WBR56_10760 [Sedimenticolaceae bacterium]
MPNDITRSVAIEGRWLPGIAAVWAGQGATRAATVGAGAHFQNKKR